MAIRKEIFMLKMLDIFLLTAYYFVAAFYLATGIDSLLGKFEAKDDNSKSTFRLFLEAISYSFILLFIFYVVRNIIGMIPFPFEGVYGFKSALVKERGGDVIFVFILFFYQRYYVNKLRYLYRRIMGSNQETDSDADQAPSTPASTIA